MAQAFLYVFLGFSLFSGGVQESKMQTGAEELNPARIAERIAKTSAEGLEVIERAKRIMPEIQSHRSAKTLGAAVDEANIRPIGWEAFETATGRWTISFYFQDEGQNYRKAIWEFNKDKNVLIPSDFTNATKFWVRRSERKRP